MWIYTDLIIESMISSEQILAANIPLRTSPLPAVAKPVLLTWINTTLEAVAKILQEPFNRTLNPRSVNTFKCFNGSFLISCASIFSNLLNSPKCGVKIIDLFLYFFNSICSSPVASITNTLFELSKWSSNNKWFGFLSIPGP